MEENKLNIDELKQVAGGKGANEPGDRAHITKVTDFFRDKNLGKPIGTFKQNTLVWMLGYYEGSRGGAWQVQTTDTNMQVFIPGHTLQEGWDV